MKKMMMLATLAIFCVSLSAQQPQRKCTGCPAKSEQCDKKNCSKDYKKQCNNKKQCNGKCADCKKGSKKCTQKCPNGQKPCCKKK